MLGATLGASLGEVVVGETLGASFREVVVEETLSAVEEVVGRVGAVVEEVAASQDFMT